MDTNFKDFLTQSVSDNWKANRTPFLLSSIGTHFNKEVIKENTGGLSITSWIHNNIDSLDLKIVSHPYQKAKIGLIPKNEHYSYSDTEHQTSINPTNFTDRELTLAFINLLERKCTSKELDEINLPLKILAKLL